MLDELILSRITDVLRTRFHLTEEKMKPINWEKPLTGSFWGFSMVDMVYLMLELEKEFGIRISPDELDNYGFSSIEKICAVIKRRM